MLEHFFRRKRVEGGLKGNLTGDPSHAIMAVPFGRGPQRQTAVLIGKNKDRWIWEMWGLCRQPFILPHRTFSQGAHTQHTSQMNSFFLETGICI